MKWLKFRIETTEEAEDILISDLYDCGLEGAQIEDKQPLSALDKERMFVDILPDVLPCIPAKGMRGQHVAPSPASFHGLPDNQAWECPFS